MWSRLLPGSSITARRPGRDFVVLTPNRYLYWESLGFLTFPLVPQLMEWKKQTRKRIPEAQNQVSLFILKTSRCLKANNPGTWWSWKPAHLLLAVKKEKRRKVESVEERGSYFIIHCPHSILATWRSRWKLIERSVMWTVGAPGSFPRPCCLAAYSSERQSQPPWLAAHLQSWLARHGEYSPTNFFLFFFC